MNLTPAQQQAITARGNVLVVAGAGAGKTRTLVERCLACLLVERPPVAIDEILVVTFTEAAAAEVRQRLRGRIEERHSQAPEDGRWAEQLALFDTAHIGTLHGFCLHLIRQFFYELELDPQLTVLSEEEAVLLAEETLDAVLAKRFADGAADTAALQTLIQVQGGGRDAVIRSLVLKLHHYTQTLPNPSAWLARQLELFNAAEPRQWTEWLREAVRLWRANWAGPLERLARRDNELARRSLDVFRTLPPEFTRAQADRVVQDILAVSADVPHGKRGAWWKPLAGFWSEAGFLASLAAAPSPCSRQRELADKPSSERPPALTGGATGRSDPLAEDWAWCRGQMRVLLDLAREFGEAFAAAKRERGEVDFADLEQHALRLLWNFETNRPTPIALEQRRRLRFVFVDEYQDINAAQDLIITAVSRDGAAANRFLVGDMKQSIYRFRRADPRIFRRYAATWREGANQTIPLAENFRSREPILAFVNAVFGELMQPTVGGLSYDDEARLRFGAPAERRTLSRAASVEPRVELHLLLNRRSASAEAGEDDNPADTEDDELLDAEKEARLVALRLKELRAAGHEVWDDATKRFRPVEWRDMVVLLRAPAGKAEGYARQFERCGVPLLVARGGFYDTTEITDLLSLLHLLDNPLQDLPLLAVLRSPLVGLTINELAAIRLALPKGHFWAALQRARTSSLRGNSPEHSRLEPLNWAGMRSTASPSFQPEVRDAGGTRPYQMQREGCAESSEFAAKLGLFLDRFGRWRRLARQGSLSRCLDAVLAETHYAAWLLTQPRGRQRHANVERLLGLAQQFDQFRRQGLFRFLRFVEAQQRAAAEPEVAQVPEENAVRLMSIHQSKGLEFPVVVLANLAKRFNEDDLRAEVILDEEYGLCPCIQPPQTGRKYPSLPHWLARQRQRRELLGEELRLLYVAMTRARDTLVLTGCTSETKLEKARSLAGELRPPTLDAHRGHEPVPSPGLTATLSPSDGERDGVRGVVHGKDGEINLLDGRSYLDWMLPWLARQAGVDDGELGTGQNDLLRWRSHTRLPSSQDEDERASVACPSPASNAAPGLWSQAEALAAWQYPQVAATREPAKTSVTALRRRFVEAEEAQPLFGTQRPLPTRPPPNAGERPTSAAELGSVHHVFLERVALERVGSADGLRDEARRLEREGVLTADETARLDFPGLAGFWRSPVGLQIRAQAGLAQRELAFTARFSPDELRTVLGAPAVSGLQEEFVVVQGVADLVVLLPGEIWLLDFKTDTIRAAELDARRKFYEPQLKLYALALERIYRRPVSNVWLHFLGLRKTILLQP